MVHYLSNKNLLEEILICQANDHRVSDNLAKMLVVFVNRYAQKPSFRFYSYIEDMKANALLALISSTEKNPRPAVLRFDPQYAIRNDKPPNPFSYITTIVMNSLRRSITSEAKLQSFRDDMLVAAGASPSLKRQFEDETNRSSDPIPVRVRPGAKPRPKPQPPPKRSYKKRIVETE